ncbi:hypothetical protein [Pseudonocardia parietis]|uniref:STAS domain-containing protein n=1 Tax=Pseudonocardia parietis TaxID=570936 RepID=A0ABS4VVE7_9PSEU|nr:hypothetical protein [Pseudonocardia parietis]MBP2367891.1 hypothetical protein [Pseudonocardia parietis]
MMFSGFTALGAGPTSPGSTGRLAIDTPVPGVRVIRLSGELGSASGARLLRLLDAQLHMTRAGHRGFDAIVADVADVQAVMRGGPQALAHAHYACARQGIEFVLAGHCHALLLAPVGVRRRLNAVRMFPDVDTAVAMLAPAGRAVEA